MRSPAPDDPPSIPEADPAVVEERALLGRARRALGRVGREVVEKVLVAYYVMRDEATPTKARTILAGALAYFLLPTDAVADVLPAVGFTDDGVAIALALTAVAASIRPRHLAQARETMRNWGLPTAPPLDDPSALFRDDAAAQD